MEEGNTTQQASRENEKQNRHYPRLHIEYPCGNRKICPATSDDPMENLRNAIFEACPAKPGEELRNKIKIFHKGSEVKRKEELKGLKPGETIHATWPGELGPNTTPAQQTRQIPKIIDAASIQRQNFESSLRNTLRNQPPQKRKLEEESEVQAEQATHRQIGCLLTKLGSDLIQWSSPLHDLSNLLQADEILRHDPEKADKTNKAILNNYTNMTYLSQLLVNLQRILSPTTLKSPETLSEAPYLNTMHPAFELSPSFNNFL
ncbi:Oidioi.mRNA.OKI2018_I69.PAR.g12807.t1.cds [Oikopleura dioica]|uniref:Oidioi.mRNA.OKI2018_I69.PAR.g12807.t1.cds n=1 Tax=Oikopleura dioica TaxID=34765 RepID=A0ABN7S1S1_OIKDI|nr:Oidioi.mRNA.OKI2018_I69.PAR.g12807.t1.cds [Oikopleura dioica]